MRVVGKWRFVLRRKDGRLLRKHGKNLVVTAGLQLVAEVLKTNVTPTTTQFAKYLALGDSGAAVDLTQTTLQGTEQLPRQALTASRSGAILSLTGTVTNSSGSSKTIREMGLFTLNAAGTMFARMVTQEFTFGNGDSLDFTWTEEIT